MREELVEAQDELVDAQEHVDELIEEHVVQNMLATGKMHLGEERARNLEHQNALQTKAMLVHQCRGHMGNI